MKLTIASLSCILIAKPVLVVVPSPCLDAIESDLDVGMRGRLLSISDRGNGVIRFELAIAEFEPINKTFGKANYFDSNSQATLTWFQSPSYPKNGIAMVYTDAAEYDASPFLEAVTSSLVAEFLDTDPETQKAGYVCFLEHQLNWVRTSYSDLIKSLS